MSRHTGTNVGAIIAAGTGLTLAFTAAAIIAGAVAIPAATMIFATCVAAVASYRYPLIAGYVGMLLWMAACLLPPLAESTTLMAIPVAVTCMFATRRGTRHGIVIVAVQLLALATGTLLGITQLASGPVTVAVLFLIPAAPVAGLLMAWKQRLDHAQETERELEQRRNAMYEQERRTAAATRIHDQVTNRLAYLILRIDNDQAEWTESEPDAAQLYKELSDLSGIAQDVLGETRNVITILNSTQPPAGTDASADSAGETNMLRDHLTETVHKLESIGFIVHSGITGALPQQYRIDTVNALHDLIDETGNNIAKHAQPRTACGIRITLDDSQATLVARNRICSDAESDKVTAAMGLGSGLRTKARQIRNLGGQLDHSIDGDVWLLHACLPIRQIDSAAPQGHR